MIAVRVAMREDVLAAYPALDPERLHVILNGIDTEQYSPDLGPTCSSGTASGPA